MKYDGFVFVDELGERMRVEYLTTHFRKFLESHGLRRMRFHDLRHPYVKHTTKIFSLRLMDFQAQAYPDARRKTRELVSFIGETKPKPCPSTLQ